MCFFWFHPKVLILRGSGLGFLATLGWEDGCSIRAPVGSINNKNNGFQHTGVTLNICFGSRNTAKIRCEGPQGAGESNVGGLVWTKLM